MTRLTTIRAAVVSILVVVVVLICCGQSPKFERRRSYHTIIQFLSMEFIFNLHMRPPIPCEIPPPNIYWRESQGYTYPAATTSCQCTKFPKRRATHLIVHSSRKKYCIFYANSLLIAKFCRKTLDVLKNVCHLLRHLWRELEFVLLLFCWSSLCVSMY